MQHQQLVWPLLLASVWVIASSCGNSDGAGGVSFGGSAGGGAVAGDGTPTAGADDGTSGGAPSGGQTALGGGGVAGADDGPGVCGDKHVDPAEQCDDGNTNNGDGCSSRCTSEACESCLAQFGVECGGCVVAADHLTSDDEVALCEQVLRCTRGTACVIDAPQGQFSDPTEACYCGTRSQAACFQATATASGPAPDGACRVEIERAVGGSPTPAAVEMDYFDSTRPLGAALKRASCEASYCATECGLAQGTAGSTASK